MTEVDPQDLSDLCFYTASQADKAYSAVHQVSMSLTIVLGVSLLLNVVTLGVALYALHRMKGTLQWVDLLSSERQAKSLSERLRRSALTQNPSLKTR